MHKIDFLLKCEFLSITTDESDTFSYTAPLATAIQGCTPDFVWANLFMGQTDVATDKTGKGIYDAQIAMIPQALRDLIACSCMDGASAMRSTYHYAGLDGNVDGTSFLAWLKKDLPNLLNVHGLGHQHDLGIKTAIKRCTWSEQWLDHVKACYNFFSKSTMRKSRLKQLHEDMQRVGNRVTWRFVYIKYHCPHRWEGIKDSLKSILREQLPMVEYADELEAEGFLPDRGNPQDPPTLEAAASRLVNFDDDDEDRVHEDTFYQWGDDPWDLRMTTPPRGDTSVMSEARRLRLDTGRAQRWKNLPDGVGGKKNQTVVGASWPHRGNVRPRCRDGRRT